MEKLEGETIGCDCCLQSPDKVVKELQNLWIPSQFLAIMAYTVKQRRLGYNLGLIFWIRHWVPWICVGYNEISNHARNILAQCQKPCLSCKSWIMTQKQLHAPKNGRNKPLDYSEVAFYEPWSESYWTSMEEAKTWKSLFKPEQFAQKEWIKIPVEGT